MVIYRRIKTKTANWKPLCLLNVPAENSRTTQYFVKQNEKLSWDKSSLIDDNPLIFGVETIDTQKN